ncbi:hypothetical protein BaRGS_00008770 [Batillaria attramentaria]|uniref:Uncharacterized protein n=1 Tax=Batillaria attramentaria TaxID=370345 RepID=A0ABD0LK48_9CAEN
MLWYTRVRRHQGGGSQQFRTQYINRVSTGPSSELEDSGQQGHNVSTPHFRPPPCVCSWPWTGSGCCPTLGNVSDIVKLCLLRCHLGCSCLGSLIWQSEGLGPKAYRGKLGGSSSFSLLPVLWELRARSDPAVTLTGAQGWAWFLPGDHRQQQGRARERGV